MTIPTYDDVLSAVDRIAPYAHKTPVVTCESLNNRVGCAVFLKCENLQKVGAFKFRGACNAVFSLSDDEARRGVATHSSGNHAQALSLAARLRGIDAHIVMPSNAPEVKKQAVAGYGGRITFCEPTQQARERAVAEILARTGAIEIHPFNDARIIAGQGTAALELLAEIPDLDVILAPIGGGGLLSGTAIAARGLWVIGTEPKNADDAARSLALGSVQPSIAPQTICDGLLTSLGPLTFAIIRERVERIITVGEQAIIEAMRFTWERTKLIIEPSSAVPIAALWEGKSGLEGNRVGVIVSGGNVALDRLPW